MSKEEKNNTQAQLQLAMDVAQDKVVSLIKSQKEEIEALSCAESIGEKGVLADCRLAALYRVQGYLCLALGAYKKVTSSGSSNK